MNCPACKGNLIKDWFQGTDFERCLGCLGSWITAFALKKIAETPLANPDKALTEETLSHEFKGIPDKDLKRALTCPSCAIALHPRNYEYASGIIIDTCPQCRGIWLDAKELEKIEIYEQHNEDQEKKHAVEWTANAQKVAGDVDAGMSQAFRDGQKRSLRGFSHPIDTIESAITAVRSLRK